MPTVIKSALFCISVDIVAIRAAAKRFKWGLRRLRFYIQNTVCVCTINQFFLKKICLLAMFPKKQKISTIYLFNFFKMNHKESASLQN